MNRVIFAFAAFLAFSGAAEAACTNKAAGAWLLMVTNNKGGDRCDVTVSQTGAVSGTCASGTKVNGSVKIDAACRITGRIFGAAFTGRTEAIDPKRTVVPNLLMLYGNPNLIGAISGFRK